jgi:protein gp37
VVSSNSLIGWTDDTWPAVVVGCTRCSEGCLNCYIERTMPLRVEHRRFDGPGIGASTSIVLHEERLGWPLHRRRGRKIFVNSQADLFHKDVPTELLVRLFAVMASARRHDFQILTKRPARMRSLLCSSDFRDQVRQATRLPFIGELADTSPSDWAWPLPNVWLGISAETQQWLEYRVRILRATPAAVRMVSAEPLLSPLQLAPTVGGPLSESSIDWVIVGGELGPGARPMDPEWGGSIVHQCAQLDIACFFKQAGAVLAKEWGGRGAGDDPADWPEPFPQQFPRPAMRRAA